MKRGLLLLGVAGRVVAWVLVLALWAIAWWNALYHGHALAWWLAYRAFLVVASVGALVAVALRKEALTRVTEILFLAVLPLFGYEVNLLDTTDLCNTGVRLFALPEAQGVLFAYIGTLVAYVAARARPGGYRGGAEPLVRGVLAFGLLLAGVVAIHVAPELPRCLFFITEGAPIIGPYGVVWLFAAALWRRPRKTREGRPQIVASLAVAAGTTAVYAIVNAAWLQSTAGALWVVTRTFGGTFSQIPKVECNEHYLCTVASRGTPALVGPLRPGQRRGQHILVNRQLAVANAFEDLLHERWPRAARRIRSAYDRLGLPLSRCIRRRWAADLTYLLMKPAEWTFFAVLRSFDADPEARIDRMYR